MADWKRLAKAVILADGTIGTHTAAALKAELIADGAVSQDEVEFLLELRTEAAAAVPEFHQFVFALIKRVVLPDGHVNAAETKWLKTFVFHDGKVDEHEKRLLTDLKESAIVTCPEFDELCHRYESI
jgi:hypothetical protein